MLHVFQARVHAGIQWGAEDKCLHCAPRCDYTVEAALIFHQYAVLPGGHHGAEGLLYGVGGLALGDGSLHDVGHVGLVGACSCQFQLGAQAAHSACHVQSRKDAKPFTVRPLNHEMMARPTAAISSTLHQHHQRRCLCDLDRGPDHQVGLGTLGQRALSREPVIYQSTWRSTLAEGPSDVVLSQQTEWRTGPVSHHGSGAARRHEKLGGGCQGLLRAADCCEMPVPRHKLSDFRPYCYLQRMQAGTPGLGTQYDI
mmetsp:Transcript_3330/g.6745  ORF Transcript_3330/g.6745 Transcript_3330/m.6745 type:complete len:255 (-) Transcript_3330:550-1314(-)